MKWYRLFATEEQLKTALAPHSRKMLRVGDRRLCLFEHSGRYHVFDNLCPHNKHSLLEGNINFQNEIVCPLHGYRYALSDGLECEGRSGSLSIHSLEIRPDGVFLGLHD